MSDRYHLPMFLVIMLLTLAGSVNRLLDFPFVDMRTSLVVSTGCCLGIWYLLRNGFFCWPDLLEEDAGNLIIIRSDDEPDEYYLR